jgi:high frequency lysogenization protein
MTPLDKQTLALAGIFQSAALVDKLAKTGQLDPLVLENALKTILNLNPESFEDIFESKQHIMFGLKNLSDALARNGRGVSREVLQYAMAIIAVQGKLSKRQDLMDSLGKELDRAFEQQQYFGDYLHESVLAAAARCYQNSVSKLNFRIRVTGNPTYLQDPKTAEKVRTLLLYGVRCALLWRQNGGRRWDFMLNRQKLKNSAQKHLDVA